MRPSEGLQPSPIRLALHTSEELSPLIPSQLDWWVYECERERTKCDFYLFDRKYSLSLPPRDWQR